MGTATRLPASIWTTSQSPTRTSSPPAVATGHPILRPSERADAHVDGMVFAISAAELAAADGYEVDDYRRISVPLRSGATAWVYVFNG